MVYEEVSGKEMVVEFVIRAAGKIHGMPGNHDKEKISKFLVVATNR